MLIQKAGGSIITVVSETDGSISTPSLSPSLI